MGLKVVLMLVVASLLLSTPRVSYADHEEFSESHYSVPTTPLKPPTAAPPLVKPPAMAPPLVKPSPPKYVKPPTPTPPVSPPPYAKPPTPTPPVSPPPYVKPPTRTPPVSPPPYVKPPTPTPPVSSPPYVKPPTPMPPVSPPPMPIVRTRADCFPLCGGRCKLHSRQRVCMRACVTCCDRCKCVPPGTYGNREICGKCYTNMTTRRNKPKCP